MLVLFLFIVLLFIGWIERPPRTFQVPVDWLNARLSNVPKQTHTDAHIGQPGRRSTPLSPDEFDDVYAYLESLLGVHVVREVPVEHRVYDTGSCGMDWHADVRVLPGDYLEVVLTLRNDSDSVFEYKVFGGLWSRRIRPVAGTVVLVRPNDVVHRVTPVTYGSREILKFIIVPSGVISDTHDNTFVRHG